MTAALIAASKREQLAVCCWQEPRGGRGSSLLGFTFFSFASQTRNLSLATELDKQVCSTDFGANR
jgi:hypothetical protein